MREGNFLLCCLVADKAMMLSERLPYRNDEFEVVGEKNLIEDDVVDRIAG